ncbi:type II toxin-antitoxin system PemK/MazF family toxin [Treponema putidum]|uniref:Type II toxin-antitoxin system PemK/MazF family toxin n=1 Tax=Treponema putidum TaxID=221027 RepID=A0AAE9MTX1_9SPIR|nr:type II toxin-antitoxin system PemK/MazF family toxin [Treponema putidum]
MTRGDIYMLDFGIPSGSGPGMRRPVVIIQSDKNNLNSLNTTLFKIFYTGNARA